MFNAPQWNNALDLFDTPDSDFTFEDCIVLYDPKRWDSLLCAFLLYSAYHDNSQTADVIFSATSETPSSEQEAFLYEKAQDYLILNLTPHLTVEQLDLLQPIDSPSSEINLSFPIHRATQLAENTLFSPLEAWRVLFSGTPIPFFLQLFDDGQRDSFSYEQTEPLFLRLKSLFPQITLIPRFFEPSELSEFIAEGAAINQWLTQEWTYWLTNTRPLKVEDFSGVGLSTKGSYSELALRRLLQHHQVDFALTYEEMQQGKVHVRIRFAKPRKIYWQTQWWIDEGIAHQEINSGREWHFLFSSLGHFVLWYDSITVLMLDTEQEDFSQSQLEFIEKEEALNLEYQNHTFPIETDPFDGTEESVFSSSDESLDEDLDSPASDNLSEEPTPPLKQLPPSSVEDDLNDLLGDL